MADRVVTLKKRVTVHNLNTLLGQISFVFIQRVKSMPDFYLLLENVEDIDLSGVLLIYKFVEYSVGHGCFFKPRISLSVKAQSQIKYFGFHELISDLINGHDITREFNKLNIEVKDDFIIAPFAMEKINIQKDTDINTIYYPKFSNYYHEEKRCLMIFQIFIELYNNFISHAEDVGKSIMVAHGNSNKIEIACVDSGIGIVSSLKDKYPNRPSEFILNQALKKDVSSKSDNYHMGYGLWFIDEIAYRLGGRIDIFTNDVMYTRIGKYSKVIKSPIWQGTFVHITLPLNQSLLFDDLIVNKGEEFVNFI